MEQELKLNDIADDLLIINKTTIERLFQEENKEIIVLYMFYYKTAKWQNHNPIKATDEYAMKCLHWGDHKLKNIKKRLKEMELIEVEKRFNEKKQVNGWYIRINYYNSSSAISSSAISPLVEEQHHKILLDNNILNTNNNKKNNMSFSSNWKDCLECDCTTSKGTKCKRRSIYRIENKNYCDLHYKPALSKYLNFKEIEELEKSRERKQAIEEIVEYLNITLDKKYRSSSQFTNHINARLDEGYTVDDFYKVIDNKYEEWHDTEMEKYLRPDTLFGTKFDIYLNQ